MKKLLILLCFLFASLGMKAQLDTINTGDPLIPNDAEPMFTVLPKINTVIRLLNNLELYSINKEELQVLNGVLANKDEINKLVGLGTDTIATRAYARSVAGTGGGGGTGSVTSVALTVPTGLTVSGSPVTTTGTLAISATAGYSIPTDANQTNWTTGYNERLRWDGGSTGLTASTGRTSLGATTLGANIFTLPNPSAITFPRFNADNTVTTRTASDFRIDIGATTIGSNLFTLTNPSAVVFPRFNADNTVSGLNVNDFRTALSLANSDIRGLFSSIFTGLTYTSSTGVISATAGYAIPTTAAFNAKMDTTLFNTRYQSNYDTAFAAAVVAPTRAEFIDTASVHNSRITALESRIEELIALLESQGNDFSPPVVSSVRTSVDGDTIMVTFNEVMNTDSIAPVSTAVLTEDGNAFGLTSTGMIAEDKWYILTDSVTQYGSTYLLSYIRDYPRLQDTAGNVAANWTNHAVTNLMNPPAPDTLGAEMIADGAFPAATIKWTAGTGWTLDTGHADYDDVTNGATLTQSAVNMTGTVQPSTTYRLTFTISGLTSGTANMDIYNADQSRQYKGATAYNNGAQVVRFTTQALSQNGGIQFYARTTSGSTFSITNISLKEVLE